MIFLNFMILWILKFWKIFLLLLLLYLSLLNGYHKILEDFFIAIITL
jgi:hypothetical protein